MSAVADAISGGQVGERPWFYSNDHGDLRCSCCLTESATGVARRLLDRETVLERARELRFTGVGITGAEPFPLIDAHQRPGCPCRPPRSRASPVFERAAETPGSAFAERELGAPGVPNGDERNDSP